ncbi:hypothetical protein ACLX1H_004085 [Fusarium chlamydosporum]
MDHSSQDIELESLGPASPTQHQPFPERADPRTGNDTEDATWEEFDLSILERMVNSFGIFQVYYTESMSLPTRKISWIGSIGAFLLFFVGAFTSRFIYGNNVRWVFSIGIIPQLFGLILTSVCKEYWQYLVAQGVVVGLG